MEEKEIQPNESMQLIQEMIHVAKNKLADDGFFLILWGWLVIGASMAQYIMLQMGIENNWIVWPAMTVIGVTTSIIYAAKKSKERKVKTHIDKALDYVWGAFGIGLFLTLFMMGVHGIKASYFFLMLLYGIGTFISGGILNYKPLVYGGICSFAMAIVAHFVGKPEQLLCVSVALLLSYIIPGHMLRNEYKKQHNV